MELDWKEWLAVCEIWVDDLDAFWAWCGADGGCDSCGFYGG